MGASLFFVYSSAALDGGLASLATPRRRLLMGSAALLAASSLAAVAAQASLFAGSISDGLDIEALRAVGLGMDLGKAALVRAAAGGAAVLLLLVLPARRNCWTAAALLGAIATASLAWMGHAAAGEGLTGAIHLAGDILHVIAAGAWIGVLFGFMQLLLPRPQVGEEYRTVHAALQGFSGIGSALVAILLLTGVVNTWILVGPSNIAALWTTPYGRLLVLKIVLFLAMIGLASANRFRFTPELGNALDDNPRSGRAITALRISISVETFIGIIVVVIVAWLGTIEPPAAS